MVIGIPKEIKDHEYRVSLTPDGAATLCRNGHEVWVEASAGAGSGFHDDEYRRAGAAIAGSKAEVFEKAELILKVKEPMLSECALFRSGHILFTYLHLAAVPDVTRELLDRKITAIAYETTEAKDGSLPMLKPMSEIAGRMSIQIGARYLEKTQGGRGVLLGGVPGVEPGRVVVLGAGVVGASAVRMAVGLGAQVTVINLDIERLRVLDDQYHGRIVTLAASSTAIEEAVRSADLVIGAVLVPGAAAPKLVTRPMLRKMRPGSVFVDIAIDQGGCAETSRPTSHESPTYVEEGVIHYCVTNMPGAVPRTSTFALNNATVGHAVALASKGWKQALRDEISAQGEEDVESGARQRNS